MTTRSETLMRVVPENFVVTADVTDGVNPDAIWSTVHFSDAPINELTNDSLDSEAKIPEYMAAAGRIAADVRAADTNDLTADDNCLNRPEYRS